MSKFPRIIRLDATDNEVYERAATPGEWAIVGSFHFWDHDPQQLTGKARQAFSHGFLGSSSFGWGTVATVAEISPIDLELVCQRVARHLVEQFGAPDVAAALPAAREEVEFAAGLCDHPVNTLLALRREFNGTEIKEIFKLVSPPSGAEHDALRLWEVDE